MVYRAPTSFTAGYRITLLGVTYEIGDTVPNAVAKQLHNLSALVSSRRLIPNAATTPSRQDDLKVPTPSTVPPLVQRAL